jgi:hypothetical protein
MPADVQHGNGRLWTSPHAYPSKIKSPPVESQPLGSGNGDNSTAEILARARAQTQDMKDRRQEKEQQQQLSTGASGIVGSFSASDAALRERLNRRALGLDRDQDAQSAGSSSSGQNAHGGVAAASSAMSDNVDAMKRNVRAAQEIGVKSAEMADNARNFAQMAKQMRQQQSSWW